MERDTLKLRAYSVAVMDDRDELMPERLSTKQDTLKLYACSVAIIDDCDELMSKGPS